MGVDPGKKGAVVCLSTKEATVLLAVPLPEDPKDFARLVTLALGWGYTGGLTVVLEHAGSFSPQGRTQGGAGMFNYGRGFGRLEGVLETLGVTPLLVRPQVWSKALTSSFAPLSDDPKARALMAVRALYPGLNLVQPRCRLPHAGIVDALLIAEWGRRHLSVVDR